MDYERDSILDNVKKAIRAVNADNINAAYLAVRYKIDYLLISARIRYYSTSKNPRVVLGKLRNGRLTSLRTNPSPHELAVPQFFNVNCYEPDTLAGVIDIYSAIGENGCENPSPKMVLASDWKHMGVLELDQGQAEQTSEKLMPEMAKIDTPGIVPVALGTASVEEIWTSSPQRAQEAEKSRKQDVQDKPLSPRKASELPARALLRSYDAQKKPFRRPGSSNFIELAYPSPTSPRSSVPGLGSPHGFRGRQAVSSGGRRDDIRVWKTVLNDISLSAARLSTGSEGTSRDEYESFLHDFTYLKRKSTDCVETPGGHSADVFVENLKQGRAKFYGPVMLTPESR